MDSIIDFLVSRRAAVWAVSLGVLVGILASCSGTLQAVPYGGYVEYKTVLNASSNCPAGTYTFTTGYVQTLGGSASNSGPSTLTLSAGGAVNVILGDATYQQLNGGPVGYTNTAGVLIGVPKGKLSDYTATWSASSWAQTTGPDQPGNGHDLCETDINIQYNPNYPVYNCVLTITSWNPSGDTNWKKGHSTYPTLTELFIANSSAPNGLTEQGTSGSIPPLNPASTTNQTCTVTFPVYSPDDPRIQNGYPGQYVIWGSTCEIDFYANNIGAFQGAAGTVSIPSNPTGNINVSLMYFPYGQSSGGNPTPNPSPSPSPNPSPTPSVTPYPTPGTTPFSPGSTPLPTVPPGPTPIGDGTPGPYVSPTPFAPGAGGGTSTGGSGFPNAATPSSSPNGTFGNGQGDPNSANINTAYTNNVQAAQGIFTHMQGYGDKFTQAAPGDLGGQSLGSSTYQVTMQLGSVAGTSMGTINVDYGWAQNIIQSIRNIALFFLAVKFYVETFKLVAHMIGVIGGQFVNL